MILSRRAEEDLAWIYGYLAQRHDLDAAERFRQRVERALANLRRHPDIGPHPSWATRHRRLRFWVISRTNYVIYYETDGETVSIERVLDGRRDVQRIVEHGVEEEPQDDASG